MQKQFIQADQDVINEVERKKWSNTLKTLAKDWRLYVLLIPMLAFVVCFKYLPIGGILQGFKLGDTGTIIESQWGGLRYAEMIFTGSKSAEFWRAFRNTFVNSMYGLLFGFPIPIFLALLFSEIKNERYRSILQVCCYLPHFVSVVVITSIIGLWMKGSGNSTTYPGGWLYQMAVNLNWIDNNAYGAAKDSLINSPKFFRPIYQISGIWEGSGYGSIVYFAAVMAISPTSYEAARIDGATKLQQIRYVTFPGMAPTLTIMLIMRVGQILNIGYEKVILLCEYGSGDFQYETGDVISSFVYRMSGKSGAENVQAIAQIGIVADLFNAIIAMFLVLGANAISRRVSSTSLF